MLAVVTDAHFVPARPGTPQPTDPVVLTGADGLQNPTSLARRGDTVYIGNAAYFTGVDPNVLTARLSC